MTDTPSGLTLLHPAQLPSFVRRLDAKACLISEVSLRGVHGKTALLNRLAERLAFPEGIGRNWDSLSDALRDAFRLPQTPCAALILRHGRALRARAPDDFQTLIEILDETCDFYRQHGPSLQIALDIGPA